MNEPDAAPPEVPPAPMRPHSAWERCADGAVHAVGLVAATAGVAALLMAAAQTGRLVQVAAVGAYAVGLIAMIGCSAAYNLGRWSRHRTWLQSLDQSAIFLMIAGTYTPFTILHLQGAWSMSLTGLVWTAALAGIALRLAHGQLFDRLAVAIYLGLGWLALVAVVPLLRALDWQIVAMLAAGGMLYSAGVLFHVREKMPFQNAIWHVFVLAAATVHFSAVSGSLAAASF